jgi:phosphatidylserine decarboxylase
MANRISVELQKIVPQHLLTEFMGWLANIRTPAIKNWMIQRFIRKYHVDMSLALNEDPLTYPDFNHFFIRHLKPHLRPVAKGEHEIASPCDGMVAQIGEIKKNQLLQAKGFYYSLETLLGDAKLANSFHDGAFATLYLAPKDYHRVHMPYTGTLVKSIYLPGKLFSVNRMTSEIIPQLFTRNERVVSIFDTAAGRMAVILVGAMIVGNIQTAWMDKPARAKSMNVFTPDKEITLQTGAELGHFTLGSTVIVLFENNKADWASELHAGSVIKFGQLLGKTHK